MIKDCDITIINYIQERLDMGGDAS